MGQPCGHIHSSTPKLFQNDALKRETRLSRIMVLGNTHCSIIPSHYAASGNAKVWAELTRPRFTEELRLAVAWINFLCFCTFLHPPEQCQFVEMSEMSEGSLGDSIFPDLMYTHD